MDRNERALKMIEMAKSRAEVIRWLEKEFSPDTMFSIDVWFAIHNKFN